MPNSQTVVNFELLTKELFDCIKSSQCKRCNHLSLYTNSNIDYAPGTDSQVKRNILLTSMKLEKLLLKPHTSDKSVTYCH